MINIREQKQCCGCSACLHICPKQSISFKEDKEGFLYPKVDMTTCIDCGLCEKVCPVINQNDERLPLQVYAAKHPNDEIRMSSSSGGIFTLLAEQIIDEGGVVFGAKFNDNWEVVHDFAETKEGLASFRGSKYVQSRIGDAYVSAEKFLKSGRKVMFTGTPCQIAGLKKYLRKEYNNMLAVDFVCHGVPSPLVWRKYLEEEIFNQVKVKEQSTLIGVNFRDKSTGWTKFSFVLNFSSSLTKGVENKSVSSVFTENAYMKAFLSNLSLRPSCYACPVRNGKSSADITIGDLWGIEKILPYNDEKGVSLFITYNRDILSFQPCYIAKVSYVDVIEANPCIKQSVVKPINRGYFFNRLCIKGFAKSYEESTMQNLYGRFRRRIYRARNK